MPFALGYVYTTQVNLVIKSMNLIRGLVSEVAQPLPFVAGYATATKVSPTEAISDGRLSVAQLFS